MSAGKDHQPTPDSAWLQAQLEDGRAARVSASLVAASQPAANVPVAEVIMPILPSRRTAGPVPMIARTARDQRILAGHVAGATIPELAEDVDPAVIRRVLRDAGITPGPIRRLFANSNTARADKSDGLPAEDASKGAHEIARMLRGPRDDRSADNLRPV